MHRLPVCCPQNIFDRGSNQFDRCIYNTYECLYGVSKAELPEDEMIIIMHVRQTFSCVRQMLRYTIQTRAPPYSWSVFVDDDRTPEKMNYMKACSDFNFRLHVSQDCRRDPPGSIFGVLRREYSGAGNSNGSGNSGLDIFNWG